jgi:hypothetical protein
MPDPYWTVIVSAMVGWQGCCDDGRFASDVREVYVLYTNRCRRTPGP